MPDTQNRVDKRVESGSPSGTEFFCNLFARSSPARRLPPTEACPRSDFRQKSIKSREHVIKSRDRCDCYLLRLSRNRSNSRSPACGSQPMRMEEKLRMCSNRKVRLPDMSGIDIMKEIKDVDPPFSLSSSRQTATRRWRARHSGAVAITSRSHSAYPTHRAVIHSSYML